MRLLGGESARGTLTLLALATVGRGLVFAYAIERLFWEARSMSVQDVVWTEFVWVGVVLLFEIPAGILSDRRPRRELLAGAALAHAAEFALVLFGTSFGHFAAAVAIAALGETLESGTRNALIWEALAAEGRSERFSRVLGRLDAFDNGVFVVALSLGGVLAAAWSMEALYVIGAAGAASAVPLLLAMGNPPRGSAEAMAEEIDEDEGPALAVALAVVARSARTLFGTPAVGSVLVGALCVGSSIVYLDEFIALIFRDHGLPVWSLGLVVAGAYLARSIGSLLGAYLEAFAGRRGIYAAAILVFLAVQIAFGLAVWWLALVLLALLYVSWGALDVYTASVVHAAADDQWRATAESVVNQVQQLTALGFGLLFGAAATRLGTALGVSVTAGAALVIFVGVTTLYGVRGGGRRASDGDPKRGSPP